MPREHTQIETFISEARAVDRRVQGTVLGHSTVEAAKRFEDQHRPVRELDPGLAWIHLGLAYVMIRIDRSLFEVFNAAAEAGRHINPVNVETPGPVAHVNGAEYHRNPWSRILQGVPKDRIREFVDFAASYRFVRRLPDGTEKSYWCNFKELECLDFISEAQEPPRVSIYYALPAQPGRALTHQAYTLSTRGTPTFFMTEAT
jgi:hypothetical protein